MENPKIGAMRVWHIPQVPGAPFHIYVDTPQEAQLVIKALSRYDLFQFENRIKPDYANASGLEVYVDTEGDDKPGWNEWYDDETGDDISDWIDPTSA